MIVRFTVLVFVSVFAVLVVASPARADCMTGSSKEDGEDLNVLLFAGLGGAVGAGVGLAAGYGAWAASGTRLDAQQWFTQPGMILGIVGGLVGGLYLHTVLDDDRPRERVARE